MSAEIADQKRRTIREKSKQRRLAGLLVRKVDPKRKKHHMPTHTSICQYRDRLTTSDVLSFGQRFVAPTYWLRSYTEYCLRDEFLRSLSFQKVQKETASINTENQTE